ncbi:hypothetical protein CDL12_04827 [Handroanthus impetiginosus]|uniref:At2g35280-like TPR domain-containing protein n=1 Tax=Handroanthus impetiginosus TaxID=429701 RepID=A0A2G9HY64_9LAMI|nr:hypothetical protein CDL12_04827 [Handroanthus impetiginosus]
MSNYIQFIPKELLRDIVTRVAAFSLTDYINVKLSCKMLKEVAENSCVEVHIDETDDFINRCLENGNSDALYRLGMVQYFGHDNLDMALKYLNKSGSLDHVGAYYVICIILIYSGDNFMKEGVNFLSTMKLSREYRKRVKFYREHLIRILGLISINNSTVLRRRPICCTKNHKLVTRYALVGVEDDEEDYVFCDACTCDIEMAYIFAVLPPL